MALTDAERLRNLLGEEIPEQGTANDTLFSEAEITDLLARHITPDLAAPEAWDIKAARLSNLVDVKEGDSQRMMSQAAANAVRMAKLTREVDPGAKPGTRMSRIYRGGFTG